MRKQLAWAARSRRRRRRIGGGDGDGDGGSGGGDGGVMEIAAVAVGVAGVVRRGWAGTLGGHLLADSAWQGDWLERQTREEETQA